MVAHTYSPSTLCRQGLLYYQDWHGLHNESQGSLGYITTHFLTKLKRKRKIQSVALLMVFSIYIR